MTCAPWAGILLSTEAGPNFSFSGGIMIKDSQSIIKSGVDIIDERYKSKYAFTGITSGFEKLDNITLGFQKSELIILASRPYFGQTALALSMMRHILLEKKIPCGYFSLQDTAEMTGVRLRKCERMPFSVLLRMMTLSLLAAT